MKINDIIIIGIALSLMSCNKEKKSIQIEVSTYHASLDKLTEVMIHDIFSPPVASRIYVYPNIAAYEVLHQSSEKYESLTHQLNGLNSLKNTSKDESINLKLAAIIAYLDVSKDLVFSKEMLTSYRDSLYTKWKNTNAKEFKTAKKYGLNISNQIIAWMNQDAYLDIRGLPDYNIYTDDPSVWKPTPPGYMKAIEPHWNKLRPFALDSAAQFKPNPHPEFSMHPESDFYKELYSVYATSNRIRKQGDESEEIAIARFWDCNPFVSVNKGHFMFAEKKITPGAHWIGICKIACEMTDADFNETIFAHTKTAIAIADAFISCWDEKYRSNLVRPETLIIEHIDEEWLPILQTPPFPEYTSGHSVVSGSAAEALSSIFGDDFRFLDTTEIPYGLPAREFQSFKHAANEAAISRVYGGIHYDSAVYEGKIQGENIGKLINEKLRFKKVEE